MSRVREGVPVTGRRPRGAATTASSPRPGATSCSTGPRPGRSSRGKGHRLGQVSPDDDPSVVPVPDTGKAAADALASEPGVPSVEGLMRNRHVGRTFLELAVRA
jgi:hypothetical protein